MPRKSLHCWQTLPFEMRLDRSEAMSYSDGSNDRCLLELNAGHPRRGGTTHPRDWNERDKLLIARARTQIFLGVPKQAIEIVDRLLKAENWDEQR